MVPRRSYYSHLPMDLQERRTQFVNSIRYDRLHRGSPLHVSLSHGQGYTVHDDPRARKSPQGPVHENGEGRRLSLSSSISHSYIPWDTRSHATTSNACDTCRGKQEFVDNFRKHFFFMQSCVSSVPKLQFSQSMFDVRIYRNSSWHIAVENWSTFRYSCYIQHSFLKKYALILYTSYMYFTIVSY